MTAPAVARSRHPFRPLDRTALIGRAAASPDSGEGLLARVKMLDVVGVAANVLGVVTVFGDVSPWLFPVVIVLAVAHTALQLKKRPLTGLRRRACQVIVAVAAIVIVGATLVATMTPGVAAATTPAAAAAPQLVASASAVSGAGDDLAVNRPRPAAAGDLMLAQVAARGTEAVVPPAGWTAAGTVTAHGATIRSFARVVDAADLAEHTPYVFRGAGRRGGEAGGITVWHGADVSVPVLAVPQRGAAPGAVATLNGVPVPTPNSVVVTMLSPLAPVGVLPPSGQTPVWDVRTPASAHRSPAPARTSASCLYAVAGPGQSAPQTIELDDDAPGWLSLSTVLTPARQAEN